MTFSSFRRSAIRLSRVNISYLDNLRALDNAEGLEAVSSYRMHLEKHGWVHLPGFISPEVVAEMAKECINLERLGEAFLSVESHTPYQEEYDPNFPDDHPRNALQESSKLILDFDKLPSASPLRELYSRDDLRRFIKEIVKSYLHPTTNISPDDDSTNNSAELYFSACPYNAAYYNIYREGHGLGWHFDRSAFGVNLVLKTAAQTPGGGGGIFEWSEHTRCMSPRRDNTSVKTGELDPWAFDKVAAIIQHGDEKKELPSGMSSLHSPPPITKVDNLGPGSLVIFAGIESLHRVTPVTETVLQEKLKSATTERVERINAILTYESEPGKRMNKYGLKKFFGRSVDA